MDLPLVSQGKRCHRINRDEHLSLTAPVEFLCQDMLYAIIYQYRIPFRSTFIKFLNNFLEKRVPTENQWRSPKYVNRHFNE